MYIYIHIHTFREVDIYTHIYIHIINVDTIIPLTHVNIFDPIHVLLKNLPCACELARILVFVRTFSYLFKFLLVIQLEVMIFH